MKSIHAILSICFSLMMVQSLVATEVKYELVEPENFRDFTIQGMNAERTAGVFETQFKRQLESDARRWIPEGHVLELKITDIDMAGEIQPWRNRNNADIRYIESVYPPRISFDYRHLDADGSVVAEGSESLVDLAFDFGVGGTLRNESFYYELKMLGDWIRQTFRKP